MLRIELPFPDSSLMPNRRIGRAWQAVKDAKAKAYDDAYVLTFQAVNQHKGEWPNLKSGVPLTLTFCPPDRRQRDLDNLLAACKPHLDGVATALTINDALFEPITLRRGEPVKHGAVIVEIGHATSA
jgi:crossover junction endodeoxyribonuclease RusA